MLPQKTTPNGKTFFYRRYPSCSIELSACRLRGGGGSHTGRYAVLASVLLAVLVAPFAVAQSGTTSGTGRPRDQRRRSLRVHRA